MRSRIQKSFWLSLDHLMPDGPPVYLVAVVLQLLIMDGAVAASRWQLESTSAAYRRPHLPATSSSLQSDV